MEFKYEKLKLANGFDYIIGCDEVGRGCLAGPVVAAAVILNPESNMKNLKHIRDSKLLKSSTREQLDPIIKNNCIAWNIAEVSSEEVDSINIHNASLLAMKKAVGGLLCHCEEAGALSGLRGNLTIERKDCFGCTRNDNTFVFIDGKFPIPNLNLPQQPIIAGDNKVLSIAAASIIAKVYRDNLMQEFDKQYKGYELARHKGYATLHHRTAIRKLGLTPLHRLTFCNQYI